MFFVYLKATGQISPPVRSGEPDQRTLNKEPDCQIGSGVRWDNNELFYASDSEFPDDFQKWATTGKYYIENNEIKENLDWIEPKEEEWE